MNPKRLIVNADDFGWARGITDGVLRAHREGVVTSATLMVNQPASLYALEQARGAPGLDVGIHLNLCDGAPVLPARQVPSLVHGEGRFYPAAEFTRRLWKGQVSAVEMEEEFRAQIRWMKERGRSPTHADSHHHLHFHPRVAGPFLRALRAEGILRARPPRQRHWPRDGSWVGSHAGPFHRRLLVAAYLDLLQRVVYRDLRCPDCRIALHPRYRDNPELLSEGWARALESLPAGTYELECHPGLSEPGFSDDDRWSSRRELELRILTDPPLRALIQRNEIALIGYSRL